MWFFIPNHTSCSGLVSLELEGLFLSRISSPIGGDLFLSPPPFIDLLSQTHRAFFFLQLFFSSLFFQEKKKTPFFFFSGGSIPIRLTSFF